MSRIRFIIQLCIPLIVVVSLGCGKSRNTLPKSTSNFKVEDTASINQIFLADKNNRTVLLTRTEKGWLVNKEYDARPDLIRGLLDVLRRIEVKEYVPKNAVPNIVKSIAIAGTKVEIYQNGKLSKVFYVGGVTQSQLGTYMMMGDSDIPFICYLPGHRGNLVPYFFPIVDEWRVRQIFNYDIKEIGSVSVEFKRAPELSWEIENIDNSKFKLRSLKNGMEVPNFDTSKVKFILQNFKMMGFEGYVEVDEGRMDSVKTKYGLFRVSVKERSGHIQYVDLYEIPLQPGTLDMMGRPATVDVDRMYGVVNGKDITICQFVTFDPVTVPLPWFLPDPGRKTTGKSN